MVNKKHPNATHGKSDTQLYRVWAAIKTRCYNKKDITFLNYGARGITMQENWVFDFLEFEAYVTSLKSYDANNLGNKGLSIDRIDNDGNYEEGNLRWSNAVIQKRNQRLSVRNKSGYTGVSYRKSRKHYRACITHNKKVIELGRRGTAKEAYQLRLDYIKEHNLKGF